MAIQEDLNRIKEMLKQPEVEEKHWWGGKKKVKLPRKVSKGQAKKNWVTVWTINENGHLNPSKKQIDEQTIMIDGIPRLATNQYIMFFKNRPLIILPSWSVEPLPVRPKIFVQEGEKVDTDNLPFNPKQNLEESFVNGTNTKGLKILLAKMLKETVNPKKPMSNILKWGIGIALAGIIGYALISGGGK
jgi:hypothetical protein